MAADRHDSPLQRIADSGIETASDDEARRVLEERLARLAEDIAACDERVAQLEAVKTRYLRILEITPNAASAAQEVSDLEYDLVCLGQRRDMFVSERQKLRDQLKSISIVTRPTRQSVDQLQAKLAELREMQRIVVNESESDAQKKTQTELDLFPDALGQSEEGAENDKAEKRERERSKLLPARYTNRDFFLADILGYSLKDDSATMEAPVFSLKTQKDFSVWEWTSKDGLKHIEVSPSVKYGRATQHDKDVLIFVTSQMTEAMNRERPDAKNRAVRFTVHNYLVATNKPTGGVEYQRLERSLDRLKGTTIKTDIRTGEKRVKEAFGIIDSWSIVERAPDDERMIAVEVVISKWLYNAIQAHEVLTLDPDYFRLRKPLERRLYELARKHCGAQSCWKIGLDLLREKCGAQSHIRAFRNQIQEIIDADTLPEYRISFNKETDQVTFYAKNPQKLVAAIASGRSPLLRSGS